MVATTLSLATTHPTAMAHQLTPHYTARPTRPPHPFPSPTPTGVTFQRLFQQCRERFLVSNEMLLKAFLTEFRDHELLQTK